jgi:hypothetical protein
VVLLIVVAVLVGLLAAYAAWVSARLRRLELRVHGAWSALDAALLGRAAASAALARTGLTRRTAGGEAGSSADLLAAADRALSEPADLSERMAAENALSRGLRRAEAEPEQAADVMLAATKVRLARQFHNDAVRDLRGLRGRRLPRYLRLGGGRPLPAFFEVDDVAEPRVLSGPIGTAGGSPGVPAPVGRGGDARPGGTGAVGGDGP